MSRTLRTPRPKLWMRSGRDWDRVEKKRRDTKTIRDGADQYASRSCRHNGPCQYCERGRMHKNHKREPVVERD